MSFHRRYNDLYFVFSQKSTATDSLYLHYEYYYHLQIHEMQEVGSQIPGDFDLFDLILQVFEMKAFEITAVLSHSQENASC